MRATHGPWCPRISIRAGPARGQRAVGRKTLSCFKKNRHIDAELSDLFLIFDVDKRYAKRYLRPEQIEEVEMSKSVSQIPVMRLRWARRLKAGLKAAPAVARTERCLGPGAAAKPRPGSRV